VDNGSEDGSKTNVSEQFSRVHLIKNRWNTGVAAARNQGIRQAKGEYVLLLDSDTEMTPLAMDTMLKFMDEHPEAGLCGCKMFGQDGTVQKSCSPFHRESTVPFAVDYVILACQCIRRELFDTVGLLDEKFFYGPEDKDFCLRLKQAANIQYYLPQAAIYHANKRKSSHRIFSVLTKKYVQGLLYYFWKNNLFIPAQAGMNRY
jgi:GT2 family glycosyltransferase